MSNRVTDDQLRSIIDSDADIDDVSLFIRTAHTLTDQVESNDSASILSCELLADIELWLAAGFYAIRDQQFVKDKNSDSEAIFQVGKSGEGPFEANDWLRTAMALDLTGYLAKLNKQAKEGKQTVSVWWMAKKTDDDRSEDSV